jgi:hypothetical protein
MADFREGSRIGSEKHSKQICFAYFSVGTWKVFESPNLKLQLSFNS